MKGKNEEKQKLNAINRIVFGYLPQVTICILKLQK
jgi:hypothetical protein